MLSPLVGMVNKELIHDDISKERKVFVIIHVNLMNHINIILNRRLWMHLMSESYGQYSSFPSNKSVNLTLQHIYSYSYVQNNSLSFVKKTGISRSNKALFVIE